MSKVNNNVSNIPLLSNIVNLAEIRSYNIDQLEQLSFELRTETIEAVSKTGGHLGAGLGVIELTIALHHVFDTPSDLLVWDIGHQTYPHKILTDRRSKISTLRQPNGLSGFTKRSESVYDCFGAGHSSTSISAALGMAVAKDLNQQKKEVVAIIGDGAMSAGMAYEALNNAGWLNTKLIVILNDNDMSIAPPVGAMSNYLARLISSSPYLNFRNMAKQLLKSLPKPLENAARKAEKYAKAITNNNNFFEELGFYYIGPIDGHDLNNLVCILKNLKDDETINRPVLLHIVTEKGRGFNSTENSSDKYHAVNSFDLNTKIQKKTVSDNISYTKVFSDQLTNLARNDSKIIAITAAMPTGTGLDQFAKHYPDRFFDVGIAEQHAVTFAAGLACEGLKPYVAIYSTFLQRAYDQIIHDVVIQNLAVRFAIDRAGLVGADGPTHAGSYDLTFLATLPNIVIMAPSDGNELKSMLNLSQDLNDCPSAIRYPRGEAKFITNGPKLQIGKGFIVKQGSKIAVLNLGTRLCEVLAASEHLLQNNIDITIADARFAKPIDIDLVKQLVEHHQILITIEENAIGGFAAQINQYINNHLNPKNFKIRNLTFPDYFIDHNKPEDMYFEAGLNACNIIKLIESLVS